MKKARNILILTLLLALSLTACVPSTANLTLNFEKDDISPIEITQDEQNKTDEIIDFSLQILAYNYESENILLSPLSIVSALAMLANGVKNETLTQIQDVLGTDISSLNEFLYAYTSNLPADENYDMNIANSIWLKNDSLQVNENFLQTNYNYYNAQVYQADFDSSTVSDINNWVKDETNNQIDAIINEIQQQAVIYLINALCFDAVWEDIYEVDAVGEESFINENEQIQQVDFMYCSVYEYIELDNATGFIKDYQDGKYSFVALLPDENLSMQDFLSTLSAQTLLNAAKNTSQELVLTSLPKFSFDYEIELCQTFKSLGITDAFSLTDADFSAIGNSIYDNIYISQVIHKTTITVDEAGTKAGAVTSEGVCGSTAQPKQVYLNRPFVFMIIDNEYSLPIFIGCMMNAT